MLFHSVLRIISGSKARDDFHVVVLVWNVLVLDVIGKEERWYHPVFEDELYGEEREREIVAYGQLKRSRKSRKKINRFTSTHP